MSSSTVGASSQEQTARASSTRLLHQLLLQIAPSPRLPYCPLITPSPRLLRLLDYSSSSYLLLLQSALSPRLLCPLECSIFPRLLYLPSITLSPRLLYPPDCSFPSSAPPSWSSTTDHRYQPASPRKQKPEVVGRIGWYGVEFWGSLGTT